MPIIKYMIDASKGKHPISTVRSLHWPTLRKRRLEAHYKNFNAQVQVDATAWAQKIERWPTAEEAT